MMKIFRDFLGFKCLKILYNTIRETASENGGIIYSLAVEQIFESLERQYDIIRLKLWKLCKGNISY